MSDGIVFPSNPRIKNLVGLPPFGKLTVISYAGQMVRKGRNFTAWLCRCECGVEKVIRASSLLRGTSSTCGCGQAAFSKKTHGLSKSLTYGVWAGMKSRCSNAGHSEYRNYGGRGITVCERWLGPDGFTNFLCDVGERPSRSHDIDRIDNEGNYEPSNCRWVTRKENSRNRRTNRVLEYRGTKRTVVEWSEITGLPSKVIYQRLDREWTIEEALTTPV